MSETKGSGNENVGQYSLSQPRTEGHQIVYEFKPAMPMSVGNGIAEELNKTFPACLNRFGILHKVAITPDGKSEGFADLGFNLSVPQPEREKVVSWVRDKIKSL